MWWGNSDRRQTEKDFIKGLIKKTKISDKEAAAAAKERAGGEHTPPALSHSVPTPESFVDSMVETRDVSLEPQFALDPEPSCQTHMQDSYDPYESQTQTPHLDSPPFMSASTPYEVDIKTESELFVNDIPTRRDSSTSTFSTFQPPLAHTMLPSFVGDDWVHRELFEPKKESPSPDDAPEVQCFEFSQAPVCAPTIHVEECDRHLLDHFFEHVSRLIFPILEAKQRGKVRADVILPAIESNRCYLHSCLSTAAVHLKATQRISGDHIDNDILKHRYQAVSELCKSLQEDTEHLQILEATLGMTFFQCSVGRADDSLPDIPWHQHFQAATSLIHKLELPRILLESDHGNVHPPFNMSLAAWIDILGSTMLGQMPQFAHTYRTKLFGGSSSGLCELMGCDDRVMYLIAEISCLDALQVEGRMDHLGLCGHITNLAQQLDHTEPPPDSLVSAISEKGIIQPQQLSKNMTALFRVAGRIYLCSLVPGFQRTQPSTVNLVTYAAELIDLIPSGPDGFDRSLVWPLLIIGSYSTPTSDFRQKLNKRVHQLGEYAEFGSFGRLVRLLREVWRLADDVPSTDIPIAPKPSGVTSRLPTPVSSLATPDGIRSMGQEEQQGSGRAAVHWRDVMRNNGWDFLLI